MNFFMLNSTEHEIFHAHYVKMPVIVGYLTFRVIKTTSGSLKARKVYTFQHINFHEQ